MQRRALAADHADRRAKIDLGVAGRVGQRNEHLPPSVPPGYVRTKPVGRPKLAPLIGAIDAMVEADETAPVKQRHRAKRIWVRLRDEHGFAGGYTTVNDYVRRVRTCILEMNGESYRLKQSTGRRKTAKADENKAALRPNAAAATGEADKAPP